MSDTISIQEFTQRTRKVRARELSVLRCENALMLQRKERGRYSFNGEPTN